jgi:CRP/FNR family transcriptional regulator
MELVKLLRSNELFAGLNDAQVEALARIFNERTFSRDELVFSQGDIGDRLYLVREGFVAVVAETPAGADKALVNLGAGQTVGEIALIDQGTRSATVRAIGDGTILAWVDREAFERLCENDTAIGYRVMRNIAADLSFKLRHQTLRQG